MVLTQFRFVKPAFVKHILISEDFNENDRSIDLEFFISAMLELFSEPLNGCTVV